MQAHVGERAAVERVEAQFAEPDFAAVGGVEAADRVEQRGLAGSRRPGKADELAGLDVEIDVIEPGDDFLALAKGLAQLAAVNRGHRVASQVVLSARTGSSRDARQAGRMLARMPSVTTTPLASSRSCSVSAG